MTKPILTRNQRITHLTHLFPGMPLRISTADLTVYGRLRQINSVDLTVDLTDRFGVDKGLGQFTARHSREEIEITFNGEHAPDVFARLATATVFTVNNDGKPRIKVAHNLYFAPQLGQVMASSHLHGCYTLEVLMEPKAVGD